MTVASAVMPAFAVPVSRGANDRWYTDPAVHAYDLVKTVHTSSGVLTRAMLPAIIARVAGADVSSFTESGFTDVAFGNWFYTSICWAAKLGIVKGVTDSEFAPGQAATDGDIFAALSRYNAIYGKGNAKLYESSPYNDTAAFTSWAKNAAEYLTAVGALDSSGGEMLNKEGEKPVTGMISAIESALAGYEPKPYQPAKAAPSLKLDRTSFEMETGKTDKLYADCSPADPGAGVTWSSSDPDVAVITEDGVLIALAAGYTTVVAAATDGSCCGCCVVKVVPGPEPEEPEEPDDPNKRHIDPDLPMIAITYDDGPGKYTDHILDVLEQYGAVATFFEQGRNVGYWPDAVRREAELGCEVASHTWNHPKLTTLSEAEIYEQIQSTNEKFIEVLGYAPTLLRPPYGAHDEKVDAIARSLGMKIIRWSVDTEDWRTRNADAVYQYVISHAYDGAIILVHSVHDFTAQATDRFIPELINMGYQLVTVSELAEARGVKMEAGETYYSFKP